MESRVKTGEYQGGGDGPEGVKQTEGPVAKAIETKTAQIPSDVFLWGALASMGVSLALQLTGRNRRQNVGTFIGQWVPTILAFGLYNKIVKVAGHDRTSSGQ
jgi:hypothetical protein